MAPIDDDTLDRLLTRHLSARLDGQLGRAEAAFRQRIAEERHSSGPGIAPLRLVGDADTEVGQTSNGRSLARPHVSFWNRPAGWMTGIIGTAVAASLATLMLLPKAGIDTEGGTSGRVASTQQTTPDTDRRLSPTTNQPMVRYVYNQTWDEGTVTPGGASTPLRRVRHQQVEHLRYYDAARGAWVEVTVPKEDVEHFELDTY
ncbi:hypothetical protein [Humisphaera borealis]|uniref:Uncharacterized protein n=1 Tax=Humisphaera borealis TaxID=2807512 RepID=A0A7M2WT63_9BACT|nr:hypothetical protein [Humisphaera borealis]QOV88362.1 hypothetical protein IPV69_19215 [Humisphaera borealis]